MFIKATSDKYAMKSAEDYNIVKCTGNGEAGSQYCSKRDIDKCIYDK